MKNHFDASPFAVGISSAIVERLSQAQAILSLRSRVSFDEAADNTRQTGQAALSIVCAAATTLADSVGAGFLEPFAIVGVCESLTNAQAVISLVANFEHDSEDSDDLELASNAAIGFLREAMETLEQEAA